MDTRRALAALEREVIGCRACPRLVRFREKVARTRTRRFADQEYWGRPVPGFGNPEAVVLLVGLAPGAHGANRTGRLFTGDDSGAFLWPALHRAGFASQPASEDREDGLRLTGMRIVSPVRCVPPDNAPSRAEIARCRPFLAREWDLLPRVRVVLCLGRIAHDAARREVAARGLEVRAAAVPFAHGRIHRLQPELALVDSYHVSRQNTRTGRLTAAMFDEVLRVVRREAGLPPAW